MKKLQKLLGNIFSNIVYTPFIKSQSKTNRKKGISAIIAIRNEPWLEVSLLSIKDLVDEYIIVDSSTYDIINTLEKLKKKGLKIKYFKIKNNYEKQVYTALKNSEYNWILRWDGDFIAYTKNKNSILRLKKLINKLSPNCYYGIWLKIINLDFDLFHTERYFHSESYFFNYSNYLLKGKPKLIRAIIKLIFKIKKKNPPRNKFMPLPIWYKKIFFNEIMIMHLRTVKPHSRLLERPCQPIWALAKDEFRKKYDYDYLKFTKKMKNTEKGKQFINRIKNGLKPFDFKKYGYPSILEDWIKNKFGLKIKNTIKFNKTINKFLENQE